MRAQWRGGSRCDCTRCVQDARRRNGLLVAAALGSATMTAVCSLLHDGSGVVLFGFAAVVLAIVALVTE